MDLKDVNLAANVAAAFQVIPEIARLEAEVASSNSKNRDFGEYLPQIYGSRALKLWRVVAISLGEVPVIARIRTRKTSDPHFSKLYSGRRDFLKMRLSRTEGEGFVTYLTRHPSPKSDVDGSEIIDALSALKVLRTKYSYFPNELQRYVSSVQDIPLAQDWFEPDIPLSARKTPKQPTKSSIQAVNNSAYNLIAAMLMREYGRIDGENIKDFAKEVADDFADSGVPPGRMEKIIREVQGVMTKA